MLACIFSISIFFVFFSYLDFLWILIDQSYADVLLSLLIRRGVIVISFDDDKTMGFNCTTSLTQKHVN